MNGTFFISNAIGLKTLNTQENVTYLSQSRKSNSCVK